MRRSRPWTPAVVLGEGVLRLLGEVAGCLLILGLLIDRSEGLPLLVEELLAGVLAAGPPWSAGGSAVLVPPTLAGLVARRLVSLTSRQRRVDPDHVILAAVTGLTERAVVDALRAAAAVGLLVPAGDRLSWRHGLTRDAVLATVIAPQRCAPARRAAAVLLRRGGVDDDVHAAELPAVAGDAQRSAEIFLGLARLDLTAGALDSAEQLLPRAAATRALRPAVAAERVRLLTLRGEPTAALRAGADAVDQVAGAEHAELCLRLAQAALAASRWAEAERYLGRAGRPDEPRSLLLAADAAFGAGDLDRAARLASGRSTTTWPPWVSLASCRPMHRIHSTGNGRSPRLDDPPPRTAHSYKIIKRWPASHAERGAYRRYTGRGTPLVAQAAVRCDERAGTELEAAGTGAQRAGVDGVVADRVEDGPTIGIPDAAGWRGRPSEVPAWEAGLCRTQLNQGKAVHPPTCPLFGVI